MADNDSQNNQQPCADLRELRLCLTFVKQAIKDLEIWRERVDAELSHVRETLGRQEVEVEQLDKLLERVSDLEKSQRTQTALLAALQLLISAAIKLIP